MQIRVGFEMVYEFAGRTPVVLMLNVHPSRASDMIEPDQLRIAPAFARDTISGCVRQSL